MTCRSFAVLRMTGHALRMTGTLPLQPIGDVDVIGDIFRRGILLEHGTDGDVEIPGEMPGRGRA